jgi:hypothetical protein
MRLNLFEAQNIFSKTLRKPNETNIICKVDKIEVIFVRDEILLRQHVLFNIAQKFQSSKDHI